MFRLPNVAAIWSLANAIRIASSNHLISFAEQFYYKKEMHKTIDEHRWICRIYYKIDSHTDAYNHTWRIPPQ